MDRANVFELAPVARATLERAEVHDHGDVWPLAGHLGSLRRAQPLPADLTQSVHPSLRGRPMVVRILPAMSRLLVAAEGREHDFPGLRVELPIHPDDPEQRGRHLEPPLFAQPFGVLESLTPVELLAPVGHRVLELRRRKADRRLHQRRLRPSELRRVRMTCGDEHLDS